MIKLDEMIPDNLSDDVGRLLTKLHSGLSGKPREEARAALIELAQSKGYLLFVGDYYSFHINKVGESCLYRVPADKRGHLKPFRSALVRIACWRSGKNSDRHLMVGRVDESQIGPGGEE